VTRERRESKASEKQAGQGFVEFALILPVLLLLMFGVIEFGRLLFIYTEVSNATREAVRFGVVRGEGDEYQL
jgi:Flp pilus assembly protein TadG